MKDSTQKITNLPVCRKPGSDATRPFWGVWDGVLLTTYVVYHTSPIGWVFVRFCYNFLKKFAKTY